MIPLRMEAKSILTIDSKANLAAYKALGNRQGMVGVYNYKPER